MSSSSSRAVSMMIGTCSATEAACTSSPSSFGQHHVEHDEVDGLLARSAPAPPRRPAPAPPGSPPARAGRSAASGSIPRRRRGARWSCRTWTASGRFGAGVSASDVGRLRPTIAPHGGAPTTAAQAAAWLSVERPINARTYRGTWLLVGIPLLIAAFSVKASPYRSPANFRPRSTARVQRSSPATSRDVPGPPAGDAAGARRRRVADERAREVGFQAADDTFTATLPGDRPTCLINVTATAPGRSPDAIVVMATATTQARARAPTTTPREPPRSSSSRVRSTATTPSSSTGERNRSRRRPTRSYSCPPTAAHTSSGRPTVPRPPESLSRIVAVVNLDAIGGSPPGIQLASDRPRLAPAPLVKTASARIAVQTGRAAEVHPCWRSSSTSVFRSTSTSTRRSSGEVCRRSRDHGRRPAAEPRHGHAARNRPPDLQQLGRSTHALDRVHRPAAEVPRGRRATSTSAPASCPAGPSKLVLAALLPFLSRRSTSSRAGRRRIPLRRRCRASRSRAAVLALGRRHLRRCSRSPASSEATRADPVPPDLPGSHDWPVLGIGGLLVLAAIGWSSPASACCLAARRRRRRSGRRHRRAPGAGGRRPVVAAVNPFALLFVLPSLTPGSGCRRCATASRGCGPDAARRPSRARAPDRLVRGSLRLELRRAPGTSPSSPPTDSIVDRSSWCSSPGSPREGSSLPCPQAGTRHTRGRPSGRRAAPSGRPCVAGPGPDTPPRAPRPRPPRSRLGGQPQVVDARPGRQLTGPARDENEHVCGSGAGDHVRLLAA